jgi:hypothetical protein
MALNVVMNKYCTGHIEWAEMMGTSEFAFALYYLGIFSECKNLQFIVSIMAYSYTEIVCEIY